MTLALLGEQAENSVAYHGTSPWSPRLALEGYPETDHLSLLGSGARWGSEPCSQSAFLYLNTHSFNLFTIQCLFKKHWFDPFCVSHFKLVPGNTILSIRYHLCPSGGGRHEQKMTTQGHIHYCIRQPRDHGSPEKGVQGA